MQRERRMRRPDIIEARILIVDDEPAYVDLLERFLNSIGYRNTRSTTDPFEVAQLVVDYDPDLILLDLRMRGMDGIAVMQQLEPHTSRFYLPILVLTGDISEEAKRVSLSSGARDFLNKPFDLTEVRLRIENLLETRFLHREMQRQNVELERRVTERTKALEDSRREVLERLSIVSEYRDDVTGRHTQRVSALAEAVARELGIEEAEARIIGSAAALHDIGKVGIPDSVLLKPGPLTEDETTLMKTHTTIGARMLAGSRARVLQVAEEIALGHHERWDADGYPQALGGADIPLAARVAGLADVVDALGSDRPYRPAWSFDRIRALVEKETAGHFDPDVVGAYFRLVERGDTRAVPVS
jgi:putative two-component system response regulator